MFIEGGADGALNGTSDVTLVAGSGSGRTIVRDVRIQNSDSYDVTLIFKYQNGANQRTLWKGLVPPNATFFWDDPLVLPTTNQSVVATLTRIPTVEPSYVVTYAVRS